MSRFLLLFCPLAALAACPAPAAPAKSDEEAWKAQVLKVAATYEAWGRVDRLMRFSPMDCRAPLPEALGLRVSAADEGSPHGQKLYTVFAKNAWFDDFFTSRQRSYLPPLPRPTGPKAAKTDLVRPPSPVGQVIVKEAFTPEAITAAEHDRLQKLPRADSIKKLPAAAEAEAPEKSGLRDTLVDSEPLFRPIASRLEKGQKRHYQAGAFAGLFVMLKLDPKTPGTDEGWVYATVDLTKKQVTGLGKIENCMNCHKEAPHDRLFGLPTVE